MLACWKSWFWHLSNTNFENIYIYITKIYGKNTSIFWINFHSICNHTIKHPGCQTNETIQIGNYSINVYYYDERYDKPPPNIKISALYWIVYKKVVFGLILTNVCKKLKLSLFIKEDSCKQLCWKTTPKTTQILDRTYPYRNSRIMRFPSMVLNHL